MTNSEKLKNILRLAEEKHLNLYHDVSKSEIEKYVGQLKNLDNMTDLEFDREMLKIFAKFKDGHTFYCLPNLFLSNRLFYVENKLLLQIEDKFFEITKIKDISADLFLEKIKELQGFENEAHLNDLVRKSINNLYYYQMLGLCEGDKVCFVIENDGKSEGFWVKNVSKDEYFKLFPEEKNYSLSILDGDIIYFKYFRCMERNRYPFSELLNDFERYVKEKHIKKYIVDLRGNQGGDSSIFRRFVELLKGLNVEGVALIDNGVFSSGRWAVADLKKNFKTTLIGEPTGGMTASFGYTKSIEFENKKFSVSIRFWDFRDIFGYDGSIKPDIFVPQTIDDLKNNKDAQLDRAKELLDKSLTSCV